MRRRWGWQSASDPDFEAALFDPYHERHAEAVERFQRLTGL
jgi:hypothetical protein